MARHDVLTKVPAAPLDTVNAYMVGMFGDDPGSEEINLNAYVDGQDPSTATYSVGVSNCSQADTNSLTAYLAGTTDCDSAVYAAGSGKDYWAEALRLWGLKPVMPGV